MRLTALKQMPFFLGANRDLLKNTDLEMNDSNYKINVLSKSF